jgi:hypothetical protein
VLERDHGVTQRFDRRHRLDIGAEGFAQAAQGPGVELRDA